MAAETRPHALLSRAAILIAAGCGVLVHASAGAPIVSRSILKSFMQEGPGKTATQPFAYDTEIQLTYTAGLASVPSGVGNTTALYLFDRSGEPLTSGTGQVVCAPCLFENGDGSSAPRRVTISVDDLVMARGGFGTSTEAKKGFLVLDSSPDADHLVAQVHVRTTQGAPGQPTIVPIVPRNILEDCFQVGDAPRTFVLPKLDGISEWDVSDWAIFSATYLGGVGTVPAGAGATLELYLFDEDGSPAGGLAAPTCAPCVFALGNGGLPGPPRNVEWRFPPSPTASGAGFAIVRVAGADPGAVVLEETAVDSIPGVVPRLLVTRGRILEPLPPPGATTGVDDPDVPGAALALRGSPNPAADAVVFSFDMERATTIALDVFDAAGRRVATVGTGLRAAGHHEMRWNRSDATGSPLAAGIYYARLRAGDGSRVTRLVFLPK